MAAEFVEYLTPSSVKSTSTAISFGLAAGSAQQANDILFVWVFWDNATATTPGAGTLDKPAGETNNWTLVNHSNSSNSSAGVGVISELWEIRTTMVWPRQQYNVPQSGTQTSAKGVVGAVVRGVSFTPAGTYFGTASASMNVFTGDLTLGVASYQASSAGTGDTDTSMGPWDPGSDIATSGGKADTNVAGRIQYKLQTADDFAIYNTATISYHTGLLRLKPLAGTTSAPTGLRASTNLPEMVALTWDDPRSNKTDGSGFDVLRNGVVIASVTNASASSFDTQASYVVEYPTTQIDVNDSYTVRSYEPEIHAVGPESTPVIGRAAPAPVRNFGGYPLSLTSNRLIWAPYGYDATVNIYRDGALVHTAVVPAGTAGSWDDTGLTTGQAYSYMASSTVDAAETTLVGPVVLTPETTYLLRATGDLTGGTVVGAATRWQAISDGNWGDSGPGAFGSYWEMNNSSQNTTAVISTSQIPAGKWVKSGAILGFCIDGVDYTTPLVSPRDPVLDDHGNRVEIIAPALAPNRPRDYNSVAYFTKEGNQQWLTAPLSDDVAKTIGTTASFNAGFISVSTAMKVAQFAIMVAYEDAIVTAPTNVSMVSAIGDQITLAFDPVITPSVIGYTAKIGNVYSRVDELTSPITFEGSTLGNTGVSVQLFAHSSTGRLGPGSTVISGVVATPHAPRDCCVVTNGDADTQSSLGASVSWGDPIRVNDNWSSGAPVYQTNVYQDGVLLNATPLGTTIREYKVVGPLTIGQEYTYTVRHVYNGLEGEPAVVTHTPLNFVTIKANSEIYRSPSTRYNYQTVMPSSDFSVTMDPWATYTGSVSADHSLYSYAIWDVYETGGEAILGYARIENYGGSTLDPAPSNLAPPVVGKVWRGPMMFRIDFYSIITYADERGDRALAFVEVLYGPDDVVLAHQVWGNSNFAGSPNDLTIFRHLLVPEDKVALIEDFNLLKLRFKIRKVARSASADPYSPNMNFRGFSARLGYGDPVAPSGPAPFAAFGIPL
jgi:hypothetical protein